MNYPRPLPLALLWVTLFLLSAPIYAGSATWNLNPTSGDWNTAENWTPATVPNGPLDTATFDVSEISDVLLSASVEVNSIVFNPSAGPFKINTTGLNSLDVRARESSTILAPRSSFWFPQVRMA